MPDETLMEFLARTPVYWAPEGSSEDPGDRTPEGSLEHLSGEGPQQYLPRLQAGKAPKGYMAGDPGIRLLCDPAFLAYVDYYMHHTEAPPHVWDIKTYAKGRASVQIYRDATASNTHTSLGNND